MKLRRRATRTVAVTITFVALAFAIAAVPASTPKAGAVAWAHSLTEAERVQFADPVRLETLPPAYRMALLGAMESPVHQANMWRGMFAHYRSSHELNRAQIDALRRAEALVTPALFSRTRTPDEARAVEAARLSIRHALGDDAALYLYKLRGPVRSGKGLPMMERARWAWRTVMPRLASSTALANAWSCDCAGDGDCYYHQKCRGTGCSPYDSWWGCGPENHCTMKCNYDEIEG